MKNNPLMYLDPMGLTALSNYTPTYEWNPSLSYTPNDQSSFIDTVGNLFKKYWDNSNTYRDNYFEGITETAGKQAYDTLYGLTHLDQVAFGMIDAVENWDETSANIRTSINNNIERYENASFEERAQMDGSRSFLLGETFLSLNTLKVPEFNFKSLGVGSVDETAFTGNIFDDYARVATQNSDSPAVVLGKYDSATFGGKPYSVVATENRATYFNINNWGKVEQLFGDDIWKINESFLNQQWQAGKDFYFSHNPWDASTMPGPGNFFEKEVLHLMDLDAKNFVEFGNDLWKTVK